MKLLLDEHLSYRVAEALRSEGFDVVSVYEVGLVGIKDRPVWEYAIAQGRVVVSYDQSDFRPLFDVLFYEGVEHRGLVVISSATIAQHDLGGQIRALSRLLGRDLDLANQMFFLERA